MQKLSKLFNSTSKYLITALLLVVLLFPKFPAFRITGTYVAIRLEDFLILAILLIFLIPILIQFKTLLKDKTIKSILLFLAIGLVSLISAIYLTQTVSMKIGLLHWLRRVEYMSLFVIGFVYIKSLLEKTETNLFFEYLLKLLLVINLIIFLYGIGQRYFNMPVIITQNEEYSKGIALRWTPGAHINSSFAGHYDLAAYLVLTIPFFISAFFYYKDRVSKMILGLSTLIGFWLLSVAISRISIAAFLIATTISLFLLKKYREIIVVVVISLVVFVFSSDLRVRYERIFQVVKQKISTLIVVLANEDNVNEDRSTSIRFNVEWPRAMRAFYKNPILGTGYSSITLATDNDYLRALGETGILGFLSFLLIFKLLYRKLKYYRFDNNIKSLFTASFIGSTIGVLVVAIFIDIFEASKFASIYWLMTGFVVGSIKSKNEQIN